MPALARLCARSGRGWAFVPSTPDNLPLIGAGRRDAGALRRRRARGPRDHDVARHRPPDRGRDPRPRERDRSDALFADPRISGGGACLRPSRSTIDGRAAAAPAGITVAAALENAGVRALPDVRRGASRAASSARWASASSAASRSTASRTGARAWRSCATGCASRRGASLGVSGPGVRRSGGGARVRRRRRRRRAGGRRGGVPRGRGRRADGRARRGARAGRADLPAPPGRGSSRRRASLARAARALGRGRAPGRGGLRRGCARTAAGSSRPRRRRGSASSARGASFSRPARASSSFRFPGWTLPGVMGAGGAQALAKTGAQLARAHGRGGRIGRRCCFPWRRRSRRRASRSRWSPSRRGWRRSRGSPRRSRRFPGKLREAARYRSAFFDAPYRTGAWVAEARGRGRLESVVLTDGAARFEVACDLAAVGYGLVPNTELARLLGCATRGGRRRRRRAAADERARRLLRGRAVRRRRRRGRDRRGRDRRARGRRGSRRCGRSRRADGRAGARPPARRGDAARVPAASRARGAGPARHDRLPLRGRALREPRRLRERARGQALLPRGHGTVPGARLRPGARVSLRLGFGYAYARRSSRRGWAVSSTRDKERA